MFVKAGRELSGVKVSLLVSLRRVIKTVCVHSCNMEWLNSALLYTPVRFHKCIFDRN